MPTVIHVSPHPDDESIAAPCTLLALRDAGWRVINFAASMGRPDDHERRRGELRAALKVADFEFREASSSAAISRGDDLGYACRGLARELRELVAETRADLVVGPHPRDGHHGHATVARAIRQMIWEADPPLRWWMWSLWSDLPRPTLVVDCDPGHLELSLEMLGEHKGEVDRNDYREMHDAVRAVNAVRGVEKAYGFGSASRPQTGDIVRAELLTEVMVVERTWMVGKPRVLDPKSPISMPCDWTDLEDLSILSSTRLRPLYQASLMSWYARIASPVVDRAGPTGSAAGVLRQVERFAALATRSDSVSWTRRKPRA